MLALTGAMDRLRSRTQRLRFGPPVSFVYNPLVYAWPMAEAYCERFGASPKEILLLGMNPGPFGMGQTGIPFGEVAAVRDYLQLHGVITPPAAGKMHPKRPILGLASTRSEVSGQRLWGAIAQKHPRPETFFARALVLNYCPLLFLGETGANVTPEKLDKKERKAMEGVCDASLVEIIELTKAKILVGIGAYAAKRLALVTGRADIVTMPHPSPASPLANSGWAAAARASLVAAGLPDLI